MWNQFTPLEVTGGLCTVMLFHISYWCHAYYEIRKTNECKSLLNLPFQLVNRACFYLMLMDLVFGIHVDIILYSAMCGSRKYPYSPHRRD